MNETSKATTMLPDSTQSEKSEKVVTKRKKNESVGGKKKKLRNTKLKKRKVKHQEKNPSNDSLKKEEETSELDLTKPLFSIGHFIFDREEMLQQAFQAVSKEQIDTMMPDLLKVCSMEVIKALCLGQLEGMSKKRIFHVLAGEEMLSSSDTDESGNEEEPEVEHDVETMPQGEQGDEQKEEVGPNLEEVVPHIKEEDEIGVNEVKDDSVHREECASDELVLTASADDCFSASQSPISQEEDRIHKEPLEVEDPDPQPEEEEIDLSEVSEQQQHAESPVPVAKCRKKKKNRRLLDPLQLEEGEVEEESSEYTDASDSDNGDIKNVTSEEGMPKGSNPALEICNVMKGEINETDLSRTTHNKEDGDLSKQHEVSTIEKLSLGAPETRENLPNINKGELSNIQRTSQLIDADVLSVNEGSEFEDDNNQKQKKSSAKHEPQTESKIDQPVEKSESFNFPEERDLSEEAGESVVSGNDSESSSSDVGKEEEKLRESKTIDQSDSCNVKGEQNDQIKPKLDVLELELRARAIRSLMKHCAVDKQT